MAIGGFMPCTGCMDSSGYVSGEGTRAGAVRTAAQIRRAAAIAIAVDNAQQIIENYRKQRDIARRSVRLAERHQQQLQDVYWPRELEFLEEFGTEEDIEEVEVLGRRYAGRLVSGVAAGFAKELHRAKCNVSRYCTSAARRALQDLLLARSQAIAAARVLGRNIGFAEYQARTDTNFNRRMQAVARGRGLMGDAAKLLDSASGGLAAVASRRIPQFTSALFEAGYGGNRDAGIAQDAASGMPPRTGGEEPVRMPSFQTQAPASVTAFGSGTFSVEGSNAQFSDPAMAGLSADISIPSSVQSTYTQHDPFSVNQGLQMDRWNVAKIADQNLVRTGTVTFPVAGVTGGTVTISMESFGLKYVDDRETTPATGLPSGIVVNPWE